MFPPFEAIEILNEPNQITPGPPVSVETHADIFQTAPEPNPLPLPIEIGRVFRSVSPPIFQAILQNVNEPPRVSRTKRSEPSSQLSSLNRLKKQKV